MIFGLLFCATEKSNRNEPVPLLCHFVRNSPKKLEKQGYSKSVEMLGNALISLRFKAFQKIIDLLSKTFDGSSILSAPAMMRFSPNIYIWTFLFLFGNI